MWGITAFTLAAAVAGTTSLWARFPVERTTFPVVGGRYTTAGKFSGVGLMRINGKAIEFSGLRADPPASLASTSTAYEFYFESFTIRSLIRSERMGTGDSGTVDELVFEAIRDGIYPRRLTGNFVISTRPLPRGCGGNSSGSDAGNVRRCTGSVASRGESQPCLCTGSSAFGPRPQCKSRMRRELHVRFCEGGGVRLPSAT